MPSFLEEIPVHVIPAIAAATAFLMLIATSAGRPSMAGLPVSPAADTVAIDSAHSAVESIFGVSGNLRALMALEAFPPTAPIHYRTGRWPTTGLAARDSNYFPPADFIRVTRENEWTPVSDRFLLRDFLTHDQRDVWPKVLVLRPVLVDKLELIGDALDRQGLPSRLQVMSGFRTPRYNALGVGVHGGRARVSRHMYGDAADVFVDADGNGRMDDLNRDGRITVMDAQVLLAVAEGVEASHPEFVGGLSAYPANAAHGPFVHVDVRGTRARWLGHNDNDSRLSSVRTHESSSSPGAASRRARKSF